MLFITIIVLFNILTVNGFFDQLYFLQGKWILRKTNDPNIQNKYTYFLLNTDNEIKIKTISNSLIKVKISRTGKINSVKINYDSFLKNPFDSVSESLNL